MVKDKAVEDLPVFIRGNVDQKGEVALRGFLSWLNGGATVAFDTKESGRRELAEAIVSPDNPSDLPRVCQPSLVDVLRGGFGAHHE